MSIYSTLFVLDEDEDLGPPWTYQGSHILPQNSDPRNGSLQIASVPNHIERDYAGPGLHDWLRLSLEGKAVKSSNGLQFVDVILNRRQVESLRDALDSWLKAEERN